MAGFRAWAAAVEQSTVCCVEEPRAVRKRDLVLILVQPCTGDVLCCESAGQVSENVCRQRLVTNKGNTYLVAEGQFPVEGAGEFELNDLGAAIPILIDGTHEGASR